jgi:outer membrane protein assembly factor BamD
MRARPPAVLALAALAALAAPGASACGGAQHRGSMSYGDSARELYEGAVQDVHSENCTAAEPILRRVRREFGYSRYAPLAELRLADCLLIEKKFQEAISAYRIFIRTRPQHDDVPYAAFKVAECYYKQIPTDTIFQPPAEERDQSSTRDALRQLRRFVLDYPDDPHVVDATRMQTDAITLLAKHELYVASYYLDHDHPDAAVSRLTAGISGYRGSAVETQMRLLLGRVYLRMGHTEQARDAFARLVERAPQSGYAAQARAYLAQLPAPPPEPPVAHEPEPAEPDAADAGAPETEPEASPEPEPEASPTP